MVNKNDNWLWRDSCYQWTTHKLYSVIALWHLPVAMLATLNMFLHGQNVNEVSIRCTHKYTIVKYCNRNNFVTFISIYSLSSIRTGKHFALIE